MKSYILLLFLLAAQASYSDTKVVSHFGYSANLQDGWFVLNPSKVADWTQKETAKSLGIPSTVEPDVLSEILKRVKSGNVEFYYDANYINNEYKNHVSAQLGEPLHFSSLDEVEKECATIPQQLNELFGEKVEFLSCQLLPSNGRPVFHHAYTVVSNGLTIINETVPVNKDYSIVFVGGSANDLEGLHRVRSAQQSLVDAVTGHLNEQKKQHN